MSTGPIANRGAPTPQTPRNATNAAREVACPKCSQPPGLACVSAPGKYLLKPHKARSDAWEALQDAPNPEPEGDGG